MLAGISATFGVPLSSAFLGTLVSGAIAGCGGTLGGRMLGGRLLKLVPGIGSFAGGMITASVAASRTLSLGEAYIAALCHLHLAGFGRIGGQLCFSKPPVSGRSPMILHVDMDAFYASVEERDRPELAGRPLIVGGTPEGRGVVAAANYAVRRFGVHSAMPTATALRLCPQVIVLPVRMSHYAAISRQIREIYFRYTPLVEPLSLDEAFLDVTGSKRLFGDAAQIARRLKQEIRNETGLIASVGVAPNKFLAKIASDLQKPDGLVIVPAEGITEFLDPLPVGRLWGVGKVTGDALERLGVHTIGQLRRLSPELLREHFGEQGDHFWRLSHGIDERAVVPDREAKSLSHETTFAADISDAKTLQAWLLDLTEQVARRLRQMLLGRTVQRKVRADEVVDHL